VTPAQAKRQREALFKDIAREATKKDRARLVDLRARVRAARKDARAALAKARQTCGKRREVPTLKEAAALLRAARAEARASCDVDIAKARKLRTEEARERGVRDAEARHQRTMKRLARHAKERAGELRPRLAKAKTRRDESDDEVRGNIPPELAYLFERVKRSIHGSARKTRTEAFLDYAHEHPDEELAALEDRTDALIREHEEKLRRANPRQPPAAWWDRCIAAVSAAGRVDEPRAVCGAAWWRLSPHKRAAIVRRLERHKHPRVRGAALTLARAEKAHAKNGGRCCPTERRSNPRELVSLVYREQKPGDRHEYDYEHEFEGDLPELTMRGGKAQIRGGSYDARGGWLEG
jgi:hypothetical protein